MEEYHQPNGYRTPGTEIYIDTLMSMLYGKACDDDENDDSGVMMMTDREKRPVKNSCFLCLAYLFKMSH